MTPGGIAIVVLFALFVWAVVSVLRIAHDNFTRRKLAESGTPADVIRALFTHPTDRELASLRLGLGALGAGGALILLQFLRLDARDPAAWGVLLVAVGGALLCYQLILPRALRRLARLSDRDT
jgi:hypothetical protein